MQLTATMECPICEHRQRKFICQSCVRAHLRELRAQITKAGTERQVEVERAARLLGGGVEKERWARAEIHTLQESISAMKSELAARKATNRTAQQRLDKRRRAVAGRRDNLHLARELLPPSTAISFSPTLSPAPSTTAQENTIPFASTSPSTTSRLSRLFPFPSSSAIAPSSPPTRRHKPPNPIADAKQALVDMGDALAETRSVLVRELADAYELQEELRQSAGRDVRMWTMGRMELPAIDDLARQKPSQLHTTLYNVLHFMRLTTFYLGVKLPFEVGWGASSTVAPPFPELFIPGSDGGKLETINEDGEGSGITPIGVGTPWIVAGRGLGGSSDGGWGKYTTPLALHLPAHSRDTTTAPKAGLQPAPNSRPHRTESRSSTAPGVAPAPSTPSKRRPGLLSLSRMSAAAKYVAGSAYSSSPRTSATSSHSQTLGGGLPTRASLASSSTAPPKTRQRAGSVSIQANPPVRARVASLATVPTRTDSLMGEDKEANPGAEPLVQTPIQGFVAALTMVQYNAAYLAWTQGALNVGEVDQVPGILQLLGVTVASEGIGFASHVTSSAQVHALPPPTRSFTLSFPSLLSYNLSQIGGLTSAGLPSHDGDGEWDLIEASEEEDGVG